MAVSFAEEVKSRFFICDYLIVPEIPSWRSDDSCVVRAFQVAFPSKLDVRGSQEQVTWLGDEVRRAIEFSIQLLYRFLSLQLGSAFPHSFSKRRKTPRILLVRRAALDEDDAREKWHKAAIVFII